MTPPTSWNGTGGLWGAPGQHWGRAVLGLGSGKCWGINGVGERGPPEGKKEVETESPPSPRSQASLQTLPLELGPPPPSPSLAAWRRGMGHSRRGCSRIAEGWSRLRQLGVGMGMGGSQVSICLCHPSPPPPTGTVGRIWEAGRTPPGLNDRNSKLRLTGAPPTRHWIVFGGGNC